MSRIDWGSLKSSKVYGLNVPQAVIVGVVGVWMVISLARETIFLSYIFSLRKVHLLMIIPPVVVNFMGVGIPALLGLCFYRNISENRSRGPARLPLHRALASQMEGPIGLLGIWLLAVAPVWLFFEFVGKCSIVPLATPLCSILAVAIGYRLLRRMSLAKKMTILALMMAAIMANEYVDWYPAKPLVRDMCRIKAGMTVAEVDAVMANHKITPAGFVDDAQDIAQKGKGDLCYGTPFSSDDVTVKITDGCVEDVEFHMD